jgi:hypothetical protein
MTCIIHRPYYPKHNTREFKTAKSSPCSKCSSTESTKTQYVTYSQNVLAGQWIRSAWSVGPYCFENWLNLSDFNITDYYSLFIYYLYLLLVPPLFDQAVFPATFPFIWSICNETVILKYLQRVIITVEISTGSAYGNHN